MRWTSTFAFLGALGMSPVACSKPPARGTAASEKKTLTQSEAKARVTQAFATKFGASDPQVFVHALFPDPSMRPDLLRFEAFKPGMGGGRGGGNGPGMRGVIDLGSGVLTSAAPAALAVALTAVGFPGTPKTEAAIIAEVVAGLDGDGIVGTTAMVDAWEVEAVQQDKSSPEAGRVLAPRIVQIDGRAALEYYAESPKAELRGPTRVLLTADGKAQRFRQTASGEWRPAAGF